MNFTNSEVSIDSYVFTELSNELRWILHFNGYIVAANEHVKTLLKYNETFFSTVPLFHQEDTYRFISSVVSNSYNEQVILHESTSNTIIPVKYRAKLVNEYIYLNGTLIEQNMDLRLQETYQIKEFVSSQIDLAVLHLTNEKKITYCNDKFCEILQIPNDKEECSHKSLTSLSNHPLLSKLIEISSQTLENEESIESYYYEEEKLYHIQALYLPTSKNTLFVLHDRSYQHRFENLLIYKRQMETVSQLSAGVAHELRNPLSVIKGFIQLSSITNDWSKYYGTVISEINRMNDIIDDFLSVSRKKEKRITIPPNELLQSLLFLIRSECLLHNIEFEFEIEETQKQVSINEPMIKQVLLNLLRNSIDAFEKQDENRTFRLKAFTEEPNYIVKIEDTGPGMEADILKQLGKPFFTTKEKGNGIGIPLCRKIIEDHGGIWRIESEVGKGTDIYFSLPFASK